MDDESRGRIDVGGPRPERQCWAYSQSLQRCMLPAGHDGRHAITDEWDDDECASPYSFADDGPALPAVVRQDATPERLYDNQGNEIQYDSTPMALPSECAACGHVHVAACSTSGCGCLNAV